MQSVYLKENGSPCICRWNLYKNNFALLAVAYIDKMLRHIFADAGDFR
jgi:hypothetical protein